jgi:hypothetical protein
MQSFNAWYIYSGSGGQFGAGLSYRAARARAQSLANERGEPFTVTDLAGNSEDVHPATTEAPGVATIRRVVESCEALSLDDEGDREALIRALSRALDLA